MRKILLLMFFVSALFFGFAQFSKAQTKPKNIQSEQDKNKPNIVVRKPDEPKKLDYDTGVIRFLVDSEDSHGAFSLVEITEKPGYKTAWHRHNNWDESFYVLEGTLTVKVEDKIYELPAGSYILIPKGTPHGQGNFGKVPVKLLLTIRPSGFEKMFKDRVELNKTVKPDNPAFKDKFNEIRRKNAENVEILGTWDIQK